MNSTKIILEKYGELIETLDQKCAEVYKNAPEIPCKNKCFECCQQLFPVSFAEAFYLSTGFNTLPRNVRRERTRVAEKINAKILEQNPFQFEKRGIDLKIAMQTHNEFAHFLHTIKSDCPALDPKNPSGACTVYPFRNHDCRVMGFSFDISERAIVGCFRFNSLKHLAPKLMDYSFRYAEKRSLDLALIQEITNHAFTPNIFYYTTMCGPLLKNYETTDWVQFFSKKGIPEKLATNEHWVVIDV